MSENQDPGRNPADDGDLTGVLRNAIRKELQNFDGMMPVEVVSYDRATNRATVKHLIQMQGSNGEKVDRAQIASIRVMQPGNGAFSISLPIKPGDKGWLMAADRDLSLFQQDINKTDAPNTRRMKSFQDGVFMPDAMGLGDVPGGAPESDRVVIGANGGSAYISFDDAGLYFTAPGVTVTITAAGLEINGGMVKHNNVNIGDAHVHGGVATGGATTAVPQ